MHEFLKFPTRALLVVFLLAGSTPAFAYRRVTDELGRSLTVPDVPHRILCLTPALTETVYELGAGDSIAGVTDYTVFPAEARTKPSIGGIVDPSTEKIVALRPDLILAGTNLNRPETIRQLDDLSLPVFVVGSEGLDGVLKMIGSIGDAINRRTEAVDLVRRLSAERDALSSRLRGLARPRILAVIWYEPVLTAGGKALVTAAIEAAGGISVTADIAQAWPQISLEEVVERSPDLLLLVKELHGGITVDLLKARAGWDRLEAVRSARVIYVDERLVLPSPSVFAAIEELARALHPSAFARN